MAGEIKISEHDGIIAGGDQDCADFSIWSHSKEYLDAIRHEGSANHRILDFVKNGRLVGRVPVADRFYGDSKDMYSPFASQAAFVPSETAACLSALECYCQNADYTTCYLFIRNTLTEPKAYDRSVQIRNHFQLLMLRDRADLWDGLKKNIRYSVKKSEASGDRVFLLSETAADNNLIGDLYRLYSGRLREKGASDLYQLKPETFHRLMTADRSRVFVGEVKDRVAGFALFGYGGSGAEYVLATTEPETPNLSSRLIWEGMLLAAMEGMETLNLGGGVSDGDSLGWFKSRFGGTNVAQHCHRAVYNQDLFNSLVQTVPQSSFFPPYYAPRG